MSDIVEKLTYHAFPVEDDSRELMGEAAAEIKRLRAELADLKASREAYNQECRDIATEGIAYWKKIAEEREAELAAIKGQEPAGHYTVSKFKGYENSEFQPAIDFGEGTHPLYALPVALVADKDAERLDHLERELEVEQEQIRATGTCSVRSLFRQNIPITRAAIDAAMAKGE